LIKTVRGVGYVMAVADDAQAQEQAQSHGPEEGGA